MVQDNDSINSDDSSKLVNGVAKTDKSRPRRKGTLKCDIHGDECYHGTKDCYSIKLAKQLAKGSHTAEPTIKAILTAHKLAQK